jgi:diacylglycerol kinase (ATP)
MMALREPASAITVAGGANSTEGELVLVGNGRLYGGQYRVFPSAGLQTGSLEVRVIPKTNWRALLHCGMSLLAKGELPNGAAEAFRCESFTMTSPEPTRLQVDGESVGSLPATFTIQPRKLRVVVP